LALKLRVGASLGVMTSPVIAQLRGGAQGQMSQWAVENSANPAF